MKITVLCLLVLALFTIAQAKSTTKCVTSCMKGVKQIPYRHCVKSFKRGAVYRKCGLRGVKRICFNKCKNGHQKCWNVCKIQDCYGKKVKVCKRQCLKGRQCYKTCVVKKVRSCWFDRTAGKWVTACKKIWRNVPFNKCLKKCTVTTVSCSKKCVRVAGDSGKRTIKCQKYLVQKGSTKRQCSLSGYFKKCKNYCHNKKFCKKQCRKTLCDGKFILKCAYRCWKGKSCATHCTKHRQMRCYIRRIPSKYASRCYNVLKDTSVNRCFNKCFTKVKAFWRK
jgi:hypothetical protein